MARPRSSGAASDQDAADGEAAPTTRPYRWFARLAALAVTINVMLMNCVVALDVLAFQCGGGSCASARWWLTPLTWMSMDTHPSRRLVLGGLAPLALIGVFAGLSYASRSRYEDVDPPWRAVLDHLSRRLLRRRFPAAFVIRTSGLAGKPMPGCRAATWRRLWRCWR